MAERQNRRRKKKDVDGQAAKPNDEETAVGKHLRFNLATKTSNFMGHKVEYFTGSKAVDLMLDSKWASGKGNTEILFTDRSSVVTYLERLLQKGMFHRTLKVVKKSKKDEKKEKDGKKDDKSEKEMRKGESKAKKEKGDKKESKDKSEKETTDQKDEGTPKAKKSKDAKRKIKLEPTEDQVFRDGNDAYVWIYDPVKPMYYIYGLLLVVGAITVCLFPLWPPWMRAGTYYLSLGGAGIVGSVLALAIVRFILFVILWSGTIGRIHLWIFPNLLADVGILESFQPTYEYTVNKRSTESAGDKPVEEEDGEEQTQGEDRAGEGPGQDAEEVKEAGDDEEDEPNEDNDEDDDEDDNEDASGSSSNQDNREEFEIIQPEDISAASQEAER